MPKNAASKATAVTARTKLSDGKAAATGAPVSGSGALAEPRAGASVGVTGSWDTTGFWDGGERENDTTERYGAPWRVSVGLPGPRSRSSGVVGGLPAGGSTGGAAGGRFKRNGRAFMVVHAKTSSLWNSQWR